MVMELFSPAVRAWFESSFPAPTAAQEQGWPAIAGGEHTLILAPTGSGKTLAAFLWGIDRLVSQPPPAEPGTRVVYISPLRALAVDVEKNLRAPITGIRLAAERLGLPFREPTVGLRTGDTPADVRRQLVRRPPDILVTTPESLYLMLTSQARSTLQGVEAVIVDEIHSLVPTKRGSHLALSLERLEALTPKPAQRIGLSATQRPLDVVARFLGGQGRSVTVVDAGVRKQLDVEVIVPVDDMAALGQPVDEPVSGPAAAAPPRASIWPAIHPQLLELVEAHRSTLIFVNARRLAERLATRLNELWVERGSGQLTVDLAGEAGEQVKRRGVSGATPTGAASVGQNRAGEALGTSLEEGTVELVKAHHGSLSRERRLQVEDELKTGRLRGLVATSSLELGIDMGAVDLVVQVESPGAVSRGLQRIGRAGHQVGEPSRGKLFPKHRHDLLEAAVVTQRMRDGLIEATTFPRNPIDVLCQHIVAMVALDDWKVDDLAALVRRAAPFAELSDHALSAVLDLLSGRYPSDEFAELRPRLVWDRTEGILRARAGSHRLAVTNPGTIPDRGLYGVFLPDGARVGELDEEMVYESRPGETFLLGATTWRIEEITHDRVIVTPAPGQPGKMPFWHGDGPGRPLELGRALGAFTRELREMGPVAALSRLADENQLDQRAAANLVAYLDEQADATGAVPDDRTIVVERFTDEIGDWRVCVLSPFGAQVHAPWAMALQHELAARWGRDVELMWSDDGIVIRLPEAVDELPLDALAVDPDEIDDLLVAQLPGTALFASRFRECAARALLLPRRRPDRRTPLWQQRQRSADLLAVAGKYPSFPLLLETTRECLNDVFDVPALRAVLRDIRGRAVRLVAVDTPRASPFAQSLLFGWIAVYMYEGDAPLAERRAAALALDRDLLADLLGAEELRELLDPGALADLELELQCLVDGRRARDPDELHDLLRRLGPLSLPELVARSRPPAGGLSRPAAAAEKVLPAGAVVGPGGPSKGGEGGPDALDAAPTEATLPSIADPPGAVVRPGPSERGPGSDGPPIAPGRSVDARGGVAEDEVEAVDESGSDSGTAVHTDGTGAAGGRGASVGVSEPLGQPAEVEGASTTARASAGGADGAEVVVAGWAEQLVGERRAFWGSVGGERRLCAGEDAGRLRDALGVALPVGLPAAFTDPVDEPLVELVARHARTHGPFLVAEVVARLGPAADQVVVALARLEADGRVLTGEFRPGGVEREHCDAGVLRQLRRRSLAKLRHEVEPVEGDTFARFLLQWHGIGANRTGIEPLVDVLGQLQGASLPASALESEILPARLRDYRPADLDELCTAGELVWAGAGAIGSTDGRLVLAFRDQAGLLLARPDPEAADAPAGPLHVALLDWLGRRGASFWPELVQAAQQAGLAYDDTSVLAALWDLVWAGLVTNDSLAPVRAHIAGKVRKAAGQRRSARGRLTRLGPPQAAGRWALVAPLLLPERTPTEVAHARAGQLLERHGVLTREGALAEGIEGGFAGVYPVLRALEERGRARRGYFVAGLGAAQFALPGAVDRLRASRPSAADHVGGGGQGDDAALPVVLAATDPAQPYGATLPWPESAGRPARASGALVVLGEGEPLCFVERGGRSLWTFPAAGDHTRWVEALADRVRSGRVRQHEIQTIDGDSARTTPWAEPLRRAGYVDGYRGLVMRR